MPRIFGCGVIDAHLRAVYCFSGRIFAGFGKLFAGGDSPVHSFASQKPEARNRMIASGKYALRFFEFLARSFQQLLDVSGCATGPIHSTPALFCTTENNFGIEDHDLLPQLLNDTSGAIAALCLVVKLEKRDPTLS